jgi:hypothetical protein
MKELNEDGKEMIDGKPVEEYEIRFTGSYVLDADEGAGISTGDTVTFMVTGVAMPPKFSENIKSGIWKRINSCKIKDLTPLDADKAKQVYDALDLEVEGVNEGIVHVKYIPPVEEQSLGFNPEDAVLWK